MRRNSGGISEVGFGRLASFVSAMEESSEKEETNRGESGDPDLKEEVIQFFRDNPNPEDEDLHEWAESNGYEVDEVEEVAYQLATEHAAEGDSDSVDRIPGGKADGSSDEDFPLDQLLKGIKVEMEHTDDPELAKEIARDHLKEFPGDDSGGGYYDALDTMEKELKSKEKSGSISDSEYLSWWLR